LLYFSNITYKHPKLMKILVTGGAGFIGSHLTDLLIKSDHRVGIIDNFSSGKRENLNSRAELFEGDILDRAFLDQVFKAFQPELVNHHAAQISVVHSVKDPEGDASLNILGTINILDHCLANQSVKKIVYASSGGAMYGDPADLPCTEETVAAPISPYGLSKNTAERYVWLYTTFPRHGAKLQATVLRYSNVYGPRQDPQGEAGVCAIFSNKMLNREVPTIFGDGSQIRDYIYVGDIASANLAVLDKGEGQAYNISTGEGTTTLQVFEEIKKATRFVGEPMKAAERPGEIQAVVLSSQKIKTALGWQAKVSFSQGIAQTINQTLVQAVDQVR
jgi:UDP-glucose 4-epimerase